MKNNVIARLMALHEALSKRTTESGAKRNAAVQTVADAINTIIELERRACEIAELTTKRIRAK